MSHTKIKFKYRIEYAAVVIFEWIFRILPYWMGIGLAWLLARFAFHVLRFRRKEADRRIRQVFGDRISKREVNRIEWLSIRNTLFNIAELMSIGTITDKWIARHCNGAKKSVEDLNAILAEGHGGILALPHLGNWDLAGIVVAHGGIPIFSIAGVQHNPLTNDWINRKRATGITILERGTSAIRQVIKRLRKNEILAILPDVRMKTPDLPTEFLGATANLGRGMASFSHATGAPILLAKIRRNGISRHDLAVSAPIYPDKTLDSDADVRRMTDLVMHAIDAEIRAEPGQWFWYNKRWVLDPLTDGASDKAPQPSTRQSK